MPAQSAVKYVPGAAPGAGSLIYYRDGALLAQPFNVDEGKLVGEPVVIVDRVGYNPPSIQARYEMSDDGRVLIVQSEEPAASRMTWINRDGQDEGTLGGASPYYNVRLAPKGDRVVYSAPDPQTGNRDVFSIEVARGITTRLTNHVANDWYPVLAPDGGRLVFGSDRDGGTLNVPYLKSSTDPGSSESRVTREPAEPKDWSADGQWIAYVRADDIYVGRASGNVEPIAFLPTKARENNPRFSPDGNWIVYSSDESGRPEVYVRPFSGPGAAPSERFQVSQNGGEYGTWGPAGRELFYIRRDGSVFAVDTRELGRTPALPEPVRIFQACTQAGGPDLDTMHIETNDGRRFLVNCRAQRPGQFTVVMNWNNARRN
jgi:serine/threonine-protein kinase